MTTPHWLTDEEMDVLVVTSGSESGYALGEPIWKATNGKWYFDDETWSKAFGPFDTEEECVKACIAYAEAF
jgi:hypothetical protein